MQLPTPPTDNLYKFVALSGLLIVLFSVAYPSWFIHSLEKQGATYVRDLKLLGLEAEKFKEAGEAMKQSAAENEETHNRAVDAVRRFVGGEIPRSEARKALDETDATSAEAEKKIQELRDIIWNWDKYRIEVEHNQALLEVNETATRRLITLGTLGILIGLALTITGFTLWYRRVQKYEDQILLSKANESHASEVETEATPADITSSEATEAVPKAESQSVG